MIRSIASKATERFSAVEGFRTPAVDLTSTRDLPARDDVVAQPVMA